MDGEGVRDQSAHLDNTIALLCWFKHARVQTAVQREHVAPLAECK